MTIRVLQGHVLDVLSREQAGSIHCVVTSPPYWKLRAYGTPPQVWPDGWVGELGQEESPEAYIAHLIDVFAAVRRVLRDDGTVWVNISGSFYTEQPGGQNGSTGNVSAKAIEANRQAGRWRKPKHPIYRGLDWVDVPGLFARAMQEAGWIWRSDITWVKPSALPESVSGTRWARCRVRLLPSERSKQPAKAAAYAGVGQPQSGVLNGDAPGAEWADCPGCPRCAATQGYVLRRGNGRPTKASEKILVFAKKPGYYWDSEAARQVQSSSKSVYLPDGEVLSQDLHQVRSGAAGDGLLRPGRRLPDELVQGLREGGTAPALSDPAGARGDPGTAAGLPPDSAGQGGGAGVLDLRGVSGAASALYGTGAGQGAEGAVQRQSTGETGREGEAAGVRADGERPSGGPAGAADGSGVGASSPLEGGAPGQDQRQVFGMAQDAGGSGGVTSGSGQAAGDPARTDGGRRDPDGGRVAGHPQGAQPRLPLLWSDGSPADAGPRDPAEGGGAAHEGERCAGVRSVQLPEGGASAPGRSGRNLLDYWVIGPEPLKDSHYAAFPSAIPARAILCGTSERGCCPGCGAPWARVVDVTQAATGRDVERVKYAGGRDERGGTWTATHTEVTHRESTTLGWRPTCRCPAHEPVPCRVLDPFAGSGTTLIAADRLGRDAVGVELKPQYIAMAQRRVSGDAPLLLWGQVTLEQTTTRSVPEGVPLPLEALEEVGDAVAGG